MLMQFEGVKQTEITMRSALHHMSIPHRDNFNAIERMRKHIADCWQPLFVEFNVLDTWHITGTTEQRKWSAL